LQVKKYKTIKTKKIQRKPFDTTLLHYVSKSHSGSWRRNSHFLLITSNETCCCDKMSTKPKKAGEEISRLIKIRKN